jgi:NAD(P)-dependent dehydrogenase (short-subunit alcohol dehydrogenase family)
MSVAWAKRGWQIGITDIDMARAAETLDLVERWGGTGETWECDVRDRDQVRAMADHFFDAWRQVGVIALNAGVADVGYVGEIRPEDWKREIDTGIWGLIHGCDAFIPRMKEQGRGHVAITASAAGLVALPEMAPYNMIKAAAVSLAETLRVELAPFGLGVTVICPTFFKTHLLDTMTYTDEWEAEFAHAAFDHSRLTADRVAEMAVEAAERDKLYVVTGQPTWILKRINPSLFSRAMAGLVRLGVGKPLFMWMARHGILGT